MTTSENTIQFTIPHHPIVQKQLKNSLENLLTFLIPLSINISKVITVQLLKISNNDEAAGIQIIIQMLHKFLTKPWQTLQNDMERIN